MLWMIELHRNIPAMYTNRNHAKKQLVIKENAVIASLKLHPLDKGRIKENGGNSKTKQHQKKISFFSDQML